MNPIAIKYIVDTDKNVLENNQPEGSRVVSPQTAFLATSMLEDVVEYGDSQACKVARNTRCRKNRHANDYNDAWFIGYTTELAAGVWVGFDNMRPWEQKKPGQGLPCQYGLIS